MLKNMHPENMEQLALLSSSALDSAIFDLSCGNEDLCLRTLQSLHEILNELAGLKPYGTLKIV